eukprot:CAMPEP_0195131258 /NCGR_PEP_ID=MMETSP0448-20130528/144662_1 /TAXON_ID=66468 /ORGANISM="Heterocapsa triquestra, Strain CCMP 448" /LENGTH=157 /DNA_ID=CAMNT_0040169197 /DNA_START=27 /DNA_END=496 /DNA_ORIENTATION=-
MAAVLKVESEGEIRRMLFDTPPDYAAVRTALQKLWPTCSVDQAKYKDEEGDLCTLSQATFDDFLFTSGAGVAGRPVLRLQVPQRAPPAPTETVVAATDDDAQPAAARTEEAEHEHLWMDTEDGSGSERGWQKLEEPNEDQRALWDVEMVECSPVNVA